MEPFHGETLVHFQRDTTAHKWLRAGVMQDGVVVRNRDGVSQGNPISPVLANLYLHHVLDLWFGRRFKRGCRGAAHLFRFVNGFLPVHMFAAIRCAGA